jgi:NAD(P)H-flavin reductase
VQADPTLPVAVRIVERVDEGAGLYTLRLALPEALRGTYRFTPGQFNMLYLFGVGEAAISIVSDPEDERLLDHTIRPVGRVTEGLARLRAGDMIGLRGPFGRGWPLAAIQGRDVIIVTGGLGCAPTVSVIEYIARRRANYGRLEILQGVKHCADLIFRDRYEAWSRMPDTQVRISADRADAGWPGRVGCVMEPLAETPVAPGAVALMCGPEGMMIAAARHLLDMGLAASDIYLSMERNMQCAVARCGHCQFGPNFVCRDGPVFSYAQVGKLLGVKGL